MIKKISSKLKGSSIKTLLIHLGLIVIIIFALHLLFFFVYLPNTTNKDETITVPNLEGMQLEEMEEFLGMRQLKFEVTDSGYASKYPPLSVLKQYPLEGAQVKEGRKIYLTVQAKQPKSVKMPKLTTYSLKNAELELKSYGLKRGEIKYVPYQFNNVVIKQLYKGKPVNPGDKILIGSSIDLVVGDGLGNRIIATPNLLGLELDEADVALKGSGLDIGIVIIEIIDENKMVDLVGMMEEKGLDVESATSSGHIFKQRPDPEKEVHLGEQIDLWVVSLNEADSLEILTNWKNRDQNSDIEGSDEDN